MIFNKTPYPFVEFAVNNTNFVVVIPILIIGFIALYFLIKDTQKNLNKIAEESDLDLAIKNNDVNSQISEMTNIELKKRFKSMYYMKKHKCVGGILDLFQSELEFRGLRYEL